MRPFLCHLAAALILSLTQLPAAVILPDIVKRDVFGAHNLFVQEAPDPFDPLGPPILSFTWDGFPEFIYSVESTSDLQTWLFRDLVVATGGNGEFLEPFFPPDPRRFYRARIGGSGDVSPPTWPAPASGLSFAADNIESEAVDLDWPAANDDTGIVAYALYLDGTHLATLAPTDLDAFVDGLEPNTVYEFDLFACDAGGNCTQYPTSLLLRTRTQQEPYLNSAKAGGAFLSSGEFSLTRTDLALPARELGFVFSRTYRSDLERPGPLGYGWTANIFERLRERPNGNVAWLQGIGRADTFVKQPGGKYLAPAGVFMTLEKNVAGFRLVDAAGTTRLFGPTGRIQSVTTRNGNTLQYNRTGGKLTSLTDDMGRTTTIIYDPNNRVETITDFTGRSVEFTYDPVGNLSEVRAPVVTGTPNGNDFPTGKIERYLYDSANPDPDLAHNLIAVISPNEIADTTLTPSQILTYGSGGANHDRLLTRTIGGTNGTGLPAGGTITYTYTLNPTPGANGLVSRTTVKDRRGNEVHHDFALSGHLEQRTEVLAGRPNPLTSYTYDPEGHVLTVTRPEGNSSTNTYHSAHPSRRSQGNLLSVIQSPGPRGGAQPQLATTFTYEPVYNQVRTVTDSRGFTWTNTFDYEEGCDFPAIGAKIGLSSAEAQNLLQGAGLCTSPSGDLNGDADTTRVSGNLIRIEHPTVALDPASNQAALTGNPTQEVIELRQFNSFGQPTVHRDAEHNIHLFTYYPESDPNGDAVIDNPAGDGVTGGYLATNTRDSAAGPKRNSGTNPPITVITSTYLYNPRGALTSLFDPRGVETRVILNDLDQPIQILRAASTGASAPNPPEPVPLAAFSYFREFTYDANDNVVKRDVEDRGDTSNTGGIITTSYLYDILDRLVSTTGEIDTATTATTNFRYDPNDNLVLTVQPEGNAVCYQYDERDLLTSSTRGALAPPAEAQVAGSPTFNPRGGTPSTVTFHYDDNGNRDSSTDAADTDGSAANNGPSGGDLATTTYDGYDRPVRTLDPAGNTAEHSYDANSNIVRIQRTGPDGGTTPTTNAPSANLLSETHYHYDELNRLVQSDRLLFSNTLPGADIKEGATSIGKGNLVPGDGAVNSRFEYDALGRLTFTIQDDVDISSGLYDGAGRLLRSADPVGNTIEYAYDDNNNVIERLETDVATVPGVADELFLTTYLYDSLNRLTHTVNNLGHTSRSLYDSRDNIVRASDPNGPVTGASITRRAFPAGPLTVNAINNHGNVSTYTYDGLDRRIRNERILTVSGLGDGTPAPVPDPTQGGGDGLITSITTYDLNSLINGRGDDWGFLTGYRYDNLSRLVTEERGVCSGPPPAAYVCDPTTALVFTWDPDHNLTTKNDEVGSKLEYHYDALNRVVSIDVTRGPGVVGTTKQEYEYDGLGRITRSTDDNGNAAGQLVETETDYDSLSRLVRETLSANPGSPTAATSHAWRAENLRSGIVYPDGRSFDCTYDELDRLNTIADTGAPLPIVDFEHIGGWRPLVTAYPINGTRHTFLDNAGVTDVGYDGIRRVVTVRDLDNSNTLLTGFTHNYDRLGNRLTEQKLHDPVNSELYRYDSDYRLTTLTRPAPASVPPLRSNWQIDGNNNWQQVDAELRQHSSFNELKATLPGPVMIGSDDNGNVIEDGGGLTFQWDALNRLVAVQQGGVPIARYAYDAAGRRVRKENTNLGAPLDGTTEFFYDGDHVIEERDDMGNSLRHFVHGPGIDNTLRYDNLVTGDSYYYHNNALGSPFALTDGASGAVVERMLYDAYGSPAVTQIGGASPSGNPFLFTGRRFDPATENYYYRARYLDPGQGRFLGRDPIGIWGDPANRGNAYAYCNNNPINCTDPSGKIKLGDLLSGIGLPAVVASRPHDFGDHIGNYNFKGARAQATGKLGLGPFQAQSDTQSSGGWTDRIYRSYADVNGDGLVSPIDALRLRAHSGNSRIINLSVGWEAARTAGTGSPNHVPAPPAPPVPIPYPNIAKSSTGPLYPGAWETAAVGYASCHGALVLAATANGTFTTCGCSHLLMDSSGNGLAGNDNEWRFAGRSGTGKSIFSHSDDMRPFTSAVAGDYPSGCGSASAGTGLYSLPEVGDEVLGFYAKANKAAGFIMLGGFDNHNNLSNPINGFGAAKTYSPTGASIQEIGMANGIDDPMN